MLDRFTYKQRIYGLYAVIVLLLILSYQLSLSEVFKASSRLSKEKEKLEKSKNAPEKIAEHSKMLSQLNSKVGLLDKSFEEFQENLLSTVVLLGEDYRVNIIAVEEPHAYERNGFEVQTAVLRLKGSFKNLCSFINALETKNTDGRLASTQLELVENRKEKTVGLEAVLYVQNFNKLIK